MNVAPTPDPELSFFMTSAPVSGRFHTLIFSNVFVCLKLNEE